MAGPLTSIATGFLTEKKHEKCNNVIFGLNYKRVPLALLDMFNSLVLLFFAILIAGLPSCSTITGQETGARTLTEETNTADTDENGDSAITARVKEAIYSEPSLKDEEIGVETDQGTVRLTASKLYTRHEKSHRSRAQCRGGKRGKRRDAIPMAVLVPFRGLLWQEETCNPKPGCAEDG